MAEELLSAFTRNRPVSIEGYPSSLPAEVVLQRARSKLGTPYRLFSWNCEHFVRFAHGLAVESPQVAGYALLGLAGLVLISSARK